MSKSVTKRLREMSQENGGKLTPELLFEDARNPDSPLHPQFDWDDSTAAEKYRIQQARNLLCSATIEVEVDGDVLRMPQFNRDPELLDHVQEYHEMEVTLPSKALKRESHIEEFLVALNGAISYAKGFGIEADLIKLRADIKALADHVHAVGRNPPESGTH